MSTNQDSAFFLQNPEPDDGCFLIAPKRTSAELAALRTRLENLPEPSARFMALTQDMAGLQPLDRKKVRRKTSNK